VLRVVIDTSVLISAIRSEKGAAAVLIDLALSRRFVLLLDYKLAYEYREVASRPDHLLASGKTVDETEAIIDALEAIAAPVMVQTRHRPLSQDPDDDMVLDVAINGFADILITNNARHFAHAAGSFGIRVLSPGEFLLALRKESASHADE
jgi:putative PIN family toxin of toxin-antitoxin system